MLANKQHQKHGRTGQYPDTVKGDARTSTKPAHRVTVFAAAALIVAGCAGDPTAESDTFTIGGSVSGMVGSGLVLQNNAADDYTVTTNGAFTFATGVADAAAYAVTVSTHPANQTCSVTSGTGTVAAANVTDVAVTCANSGSGYIVGGSVSGLTGSGLVLQNNGGDDLSITNDGAFGFTTAIADAASYSVTVKTQPSGQTCAVSSGSGTIASANVSSVAVACTAATAIGSRTWSTAALLETNNNSGTTSSNAVFDQDGNIHVFWMQSDGTATSLYARRYDAGTSTWGTAATIETSTSATSGTPRAAVDASGNVLVGFILNGSIATNYFNASTSSWVGAQNHETGGDVIAQFDVAMSANGNAFVVWIQNDTVADSLWARHYDGATSTWQGTTGDDFRIETYTNNGFNPEIVMDDTGNAFVIWSQNTGTNQDIVTLEYTQGTSSWGTTPVILNSDTVNNATVPKVGMDASGNIVVVWQQTAGAIENIWANRYVASTTSWGTASKIETVDTGTALAPAVAVASSGDAIAVWEQDNGSALHEVWAAVYDASTTSWGARTRINDAVSNTLGAGGNAAVAIDGAGNGVVLYAEVDSGGATFSIWYNTYNTTTSAWGTAAALDADTGDTSDQTVAFDGGETAIGLWSQHDGTRKNLHYRILQ